MRPWSRPIGQGWPGLDDRRPTTDDRAADGSGYSVAGVRAAAPEAPTAPAEAPTEVPTRQEPPGERGKETPSEPDIDEQIKRILREIPDPTPQPGGQ